MNAVKVTAVSVAMLCAVAAAQQNSRSGAIREQNADSTVAGKKAVILSGQVSKDGKSLNSEDHDVWAVNNPGMLAGHLGQAVTVKCQLSADQKSIHVLVIKPAETKYVAAHSDAAFRR